MLIYTFATHVRLHTFQVFWFPKRVMIRNSTATFLVHVSQRVHQYTSGKSMGWEIQGPLLLA